MRKFWNYLLNPKGWVYVLTFLVTLCLIALDFVCLYFFREMFVVYIVYGLSAIGLVYSVYLFVKICPRIKQKTRYLLNKNKYTKRMLEDKNFRRSVTAVASDIVNIAYLILLSVMAFKSRSIWICLLAGYYFVLCLTKTILLFGGLKVIKNKVQDTELKTIKIYRNCGIFFIIMAIAMNGMLIQMITMEAEISYAELFIYVVALYTFYKVVMTIINIIKERHNKNHIMRAIVNINTITSVVSLFSLQIAMIKTFSTGEYLSALNIFSGIVVGIVILGLGIFMIIKGKRDIKKLILERELKKEGEDSYGEQI